MTRPGAGAVQPEVIRLYEKGERIYPRETGGRFQRLRVAAVWWLLGMYYVLPWLSWDQRQMVLFDLPARKFYVFGMVFWPQDFIFLTGLLILAALSLFFFTALLGRVWCGYACPQTVWTESFLWLERLAEGPALKRKRRDAGPWSWDKVWRKAFKQLLWLSFALWTGFTFVGYFTPIRELAAGVAGWSLGPWETFWVLFYSLATYGNAGYLREQVCKYMCPYARFQSAMFDRDSLVISYDLERGEPRGSRSRRADPQTLGLGDCIDCTLCVQVCPTGIDIRQGLQYECIACAACVDACDAVMDRMNYPRGLVRYTTQNALEGKPNRIIRGRTILYAVLLSAIAGVWVLGVATRPVLSADVIRDRNALYRITASGAVENAYTLRILNRSDTDRRYTLAVSGLPGLRLVGDPAIALEAGGVGSLPVTVAAPPGSAAGGRDIQFNITAVEDPAIHVDVPSRFIGPVP